MICGKHGDVGSGYGTKRERCPKCNIEGVTAHRQRLKQKAVAHLGGCCSRCGYDKCADAFDFHHRDPKEKEFGISSARYSTYSWARLQAELDKCILLCANCHREVHAGL